MQSSKEIIEQAYKLFSGYTLGDSLDACTFCCMSKEAEKRLMTYPLKNISVEDLKEYQDAAKPQQLKINELKYLTPRYIELIIAHSYPSFEPLLSLDRFGHFQKEDWSKSEKAVLDAFAVHFMQAYYPYYSNGQDCMPIEVLLMFYKGKFDLPKLMKEWDSIPFLEYHTFWCGLLHGIEMDIYSKPRVWDAFSDETFNQLVIDWLFTEHKSKYFMNEIEALIMNPPQSISDHELTQISVYYTFFESVLNKG